MHFRKAGLKVSKKINCIGLSYDTQSYMNLTDLPIKLLVIYRLQHQEATASVLYEKGKSK